MDAKKKYTITVLRSLCSSHKNPVLILEILRNFVEVEGVHLNVEQFGYKSVEEFLRSTNEFKFEKKNGQVYISSKFKEESQHIDLLVSRQKAPRKKYSSISVRQPKKSDNSWNKSTYATNVFPKIRNRIGSHIISQRQSNSRSYSGDSNNNRFPNRNGCNSGKQSQKSCDTERNNHSKPVGGENKVEIPSPTDINRRLPESSKAITSPPAPRAILGQNCQPTPNQNKIKSNTGTKNESKQHFNSTQNQQKELIKPTKTSSAQISASKTTNMRPSSSHRSAPTTETQNRTMVNKNRSVQKTSVQDRFRIAAMQCKSAKISEKLNNAGNFEDKLVVSNESKETLLAQNQQSSVFEFNPNLNPISALEEYCRFRRYPLPEYKTMIAKFCKKFHCRIMLNNRIYTTYPEEYETDLDSRKACAKMTMQEIQRIEQRNQQIPLCTDSDYELMMKICAELENHTSGLFAKDLPDCFVKTYKQTLPDNWWIRMKNFDIFITESLAEKQLLLLKPLNARGSNINCKPKNGSLPPIELPWKNKYWNLYITNCISTVSVWARLLDENNELFEKLINDIEFHMKSSKSRPVSIELDQVYLVFIVDSWHRVRVDKLEPISESCICFFIDFGDKDSIKYDQLYTCEAEFLKLPAQAIPFSLFGLEDFAENPVTGPHLEKLVLEKSLVGEILTTQSSYESENADTNSPVHIQCALYDTSSNEDINLNPLLLNLFCNDTRIPEIKSSITNVIITFVTNEGDIYLQVAKRELAYVKKLVQQLVESKFKRDQHVVSYEDINKTSLYLILDNEDDCWYRGKLANPELFTSKSFVPIFYVDVGVTKNIDIKNIFRLESLSAALARFPYQGLKVRLNNLPVLNETIVARIRGLLPAELTAVAKLIKTDVIPYVDIYRRFDSVTSLCNVNEIIRVEYEMEQSSDIFDDELLTNGATLSDLTISPKSTFAKTSKNLPEMPQIKPYEVIPSNTNLFDVIVYSSTNPSNFVVQPYTDSPKLIELLGELQTHCANYNKIYTKESVKPGEAYAALNSNGVYHRIIVLSVFSQSLFRVFFCDAGNISIINIQQLKELPTKFRSLPMQAIQATLSDITSTNSEWTINDCKRFFDLTRGKKFVSVIKKIKKADNNYKNCSLELELIDVSTDKDLLISEILVSENRAKKNL